MIGSRAPDHVGLKWASMVAEAACERGTVVISGGARGIDERAHLVALDHGGESLAVLGCGMNHVGHRHRHLAAQGVGLITSFEDHVSARRWTFPQRNKLIAALADQIIVIQASAKSGSLSTARAALKYNKQVWVLTHLPSHPLHQGCLQLLSEGARPLIDTYSWSQDHTQALSHPSHTHQITSNQSTLNSSPSSSRALPQHESALWRASSDEPRDLEQLALDAGISFADALAEATILELQGWFNASLGGRYQRAYGPQQGR